MLHKDSIYKMTVQYEMMIYMSQTDRTLINTTSLQTKSLLFALYVTITPHGSMV